MTTDQHRIRITSAGDEKIVELDGVDITDSLTGVFVAMDPHDTIVTMHLRPGVVLDGVVTAQAEIPADVGSLVQEALRGLDAEEITESALNDLGWGGEPGSTAQAIIDEIGRRLAVMLS